MIVTCDVTCDQAIACQLSELSVLLDQTLYFISAGQEGLRGGGGDYSREAINRGTAIIRGNAVLTAYDHGISSSKHAFNRKKKEKKRS